MLKMNDTTDRLLSSWTVFLSKKGKAVDDLKKIDELKRFVVSFALLYINIKFKCYVSLTHMILKVSQSDLRPYKQFSNSRATDLRFKFLSLTAVSSA